jgi:PAS domain S-box-containing protein
MKENDTEKPRILLVDDDSNHVELLLRSLEGGEGAFCCVVAENLARARECLAAQLPDLVLADYCLPDGVGKDIIQDAAGRFPVVILTSYGDERLVRDVFQAGAFDYVTKSPESFALMPRIVDWTIREWRSRIARQRAETALIEQGRFLNVLLEAMPLPVFYKDAGGVYLGCNRAFEQAMGVSREEMIGKTVMSMPREQNEILRRHDEELFLNPGVQRYEVHLPDSQGSIRDVILTKATFPDAKGDVAGIVGVLMDITAQKATEEKLRRSLEQNQILLREVHHRVKNNLQVIISLLSLQLAEVTEPKLRDVLLESQSRIRAMALIQEQLYREEEFARLDFHHYVSSLVSQLVAPYRTEERPGSPALRIEVEPVSLTLEQAIPLGLILNELVTNCLKHAFPEACSQSMEEREIRIGLRRETDHVLLEVADNGVGLPQNLEQRRTRSLGMRIIDTLTQQLEGVVRMEDEKQQGGARIRVLIPALHDAT